MIFDVDVIKIILQQMIRDAQKGIKVEAEIRLLIPEEMSSDEELTKSKLLSERSSVLKN